MCPLNLILTSSALPRSLKAPSQLCSITHYRVTITRDVASPQP